MLSNIRQCAIVSSMFMLTGCGLVHELSSPPVIEDKLHYSVSKEDSKQAVAGTLALDASRRVVVVRLGNPVGSPDAGKFCAEPPPTIATETHDALKAGLQLAANRGTTGPGGVFNIDETFDQNVVLIPEGSEAVNIMRVGAYALCQYHVNGAITSDALMQGWMVLLDRATAIALSSHKYGRSSLQPVKKEQKPDSDGASRAEVKTDSLKQPAQPEAPAKPR